MTVSAADSLTAAKNLVQSVNDAGRTHLGIQGILVACGISAAKLVAPGPGRLAVLSVLTSGSGGFIYDSNNPGVTTAPLCAISGTPGVYPINLPFNNGLLVVPGSGSSVTVSYTIGGAIGSQQGG